MNAGKREQDRQPDDERTQVGLCSHCRFMRRMESDRGSIFYYCKLSETDLAFPKYPRLPVLRCTGYRPLSKDGPNQ